MKRDFEYDFSGWATRTGVRCSDGRTIMQDAFKHNDGNICPLVWNHRHNDPEAVLGQVMLENRPDGVYAYGSFNNTQKAQVAKELLKHGDIDSLSIYANDLKENLSCVTHGNIKEVSLVLAGANPQAYIDNVVCHGEEKNDEADIYIGGEISFNNGIYHSDKNQNGGYSMKKTVGEVFDTLNEEQKKAVYAVIGAALEEKESDEDEYNEEENESDENKYDKGDNNMKHNVFEGDFENQDFLQHSQEFMNNVIADGKRYGSMKDSFLAHAEDYGIDNIDLLFPEDRYVDTGVPEFIKRDTDWVSKVITSVHHSPFSKTKSIFANITEDEARAKGYIKGKYKKEEVFTLLKRSTAPTTVYKKQRIDKDDILDITSFDIIAWIKKEMRMMLDEELARSFLIGDGRLASSDDKINPQNIRPIAYDDDLFTVKRQVQVSSNDGAEMAKQFIKDVIRSRKEYKGSGDPTLYTTEDVVTECLLLEDEIGRQKYDSITKLANTLRVKEIVTVPVMENEVGVNGGKLLGIIVNLKDYNVGADKGGEINMFDDFDIDYNQNKYLIETRCSGALVKPYSAIAFELEINI